MTLTQRIGEYCQICTSSWCSEVTNPVYCEEHAGGKEYYRIMKERKIEDESI